MAQTRLRAIDGLRGIAVLLVLWYHVWQLSWLPAPLPALQFIPETGFAGVDLFFYISGFVIAYPFVKSVAAGQAPPTWPHFAYRRAMKIVPSYALSIAFAVAIGYAQFHSAGQLLRDLLAHLLFVHTWWLDTASSINGVLWTLAVEVQFYAVFPLLWIVFKHYPWLTAAAMTGIALVYRAHALQCCTPAGMDLLAYNLPAYLDLFDAGTICALLFVRWREARCAWLPPLATAAAAAGFAMLMLLLEDAWGTRQSDQWYTVWLLQNRTLLAIAFSMLGLGSLLAVPVWQRLVGNPLLLFLAAISYNLYIYHQMLARLLAAWHLPPLAFTIVAFSASIALAAAITFAFERPLLRIPAERFKQFVSRKARVRALSQV